MTATPDDHALAPYLRRLRGLVAEGAVPSTIVRSLAVALLQSSGITPPGELATAAELPAEIVLPPEHLRTPWVLGQAHEALLDAATRRKAGAHYTAAPVARGLVAFAREAHTVASPRVCDPAVGGGAFLLAAAESLAANGHARETIVRELCFGSDVDPLSVDVSRAALALWASAWPDELDRHVVTADPLHEPAPWRVPFDLVVGNPPFQNQLERHTVRARPDAARLRERFGDAAVGYVDTAALFLLVALDLAAPGARIALVQPHSTLVARDAQRVRAELLQGSTLVGVWFAAQPVFDAGVRVWAPVLEHGRSARVSIARRREANFEHAPPVDATASSATWAPLVVDLTGVPCADVCSRGTVGDLATATAGFRDQFYGLVGAVREQRCDDESLTPRLVTSGLIEPLALAWGDLTATFARERFRHPVVDVEALEADVARWVRAQLVPKLVVATQTRVLEVAVDERGDVVPSTPVIAVHAPPDHLWRLAAAMSAPPVTAIALRTAFGAALSTHAVKLSARQVLGLPLPADENAWDHAARLARAAAAVPRADHAARAAALAEYGAAACVAYGVASSDMLDWWLTRALDPPSRRRMVEG